MSKETILNKNKSDLLALIKKQEKTIYNLENTLSTYKRICDNSLDVYLQDCTKWKNNQC
ncbi:hypothetical protein GCM10007963_13790 [Lutibacter litoralis]|nr:hypothetical protein GCM10007963_13790 [Lutibacter litoralis]